MNALWTRPGLRPDVELAVALELSAYELTRAKSPRQLEQAISLNLRLWRTLRQLTEVGWAVCRRETLADTADHVVTMLVAEATPCPDPRDLAFIAGRNLALARDLAGKSAAESAMAALMSGWGGAGGGINAFVLWLIGRLGLEEERYPNA